METHVQETVVTLDVSWRLVVQTITSVLVSVEIAAVRNVEAIVNVQETAVETAIVSLVSLVSTVQFPSSVETEHVSQTKRSLQKLFEEKT